MGLLLLIGFALMLLASLPRWRRADGPRSTAIVCTAAASLLVLVLLLLDQLPRGF